MNEPSLSPPKSFSTRRTGLLSFLKYTLVAVVFGALLGAVAVLIIYPLWYLATEHKDIYSTLIALSLSPLALLFVLRARRAFRNGLFAEFCLKAGGFLAFTIFLCTQTVWALLQMVLYALIRTAGMAPLGPLLLTLAVGWSAFGLAWWAIVLRRKKIWGKAAFVSAWIIFGAHIAYWTAVFAYHGFWIHTIVAGLIILGFSFFLKLTKMKREKKSPDNETFRP